MLLVLVTTTVNGSNTVHFSRIQHFISKHFEYFTHLIRRNSNHVHHLFFEESSIEMFFMESQRTLFGTFIFKSVEQLAFLLDPYMMTRYVFSSIFYSLMFLHV